MGSAFKLQPSRLPLGTRRGAPPDVTAFLYIFRVIFFRDLFGSVDLPLLGDRGKRNSPKNEQ